MQVFGSWIVKHRAKSYEHHLLISPRKTKYVARVIYFSLQGTGPCYTKATIVKARVVRAKFSRYPVLNR